MRNKILAASGVLGAALTAIAIIGYTSIEASAGKVSVAIPGPVDALADPGFVCFTGCAVTVWPTITPAGVVELQLWSVNSPDPIADPKAVPPRPTTTRRDGLRDRTDHYPRRRVRGAG